MQTLPKIIYGTAWKQERTAELVIQAVGLGFRGIDTACQPKHYHEAGVGDGLASCLQHGLQRGDLYLQSKFTPLDGQDPHRLPYPADAGLAEQVRQSCACSLANLRTDYLDGLILHSPLATRHDLLTVWRTMEALHAGGSVRRLGISNCYQPQLLVWLHAQARVKPSLLQNRFYPRTGYDRELREFCDRNGIVYQSFWTLTANADFLASRAVSVLADRYQRTPAQIFFRFLTQLGIVPLTGTTSAQHMREDLAIFEFELSAAECTLLQQMLTEE